MFVIFNDFYNTLAGSYLENNEVVSTQIQNSPSPEVLNRIKNISCIVWNQPQLSGGTYYLEPQTEYLLKSFGPDLFIWPIVNTSPSEAKNRSRGFAEDGAILIPSDSLTAGL